jgi:hypothetical protein
MVLAEVDPRTVVLVVVSLDLFGLLRPAFRS